MKPISILLDHETSEILTDAGECFVVAHRLMDTARPDINRRWILTLVPASITQVNAAVRRDHRIPSRIEDQTRIEQANLTRPHLKWARSLKPRRCPSSDLDAEHHPGSDFASR